MPNPSEPKEDKPKPQRNKGEGSIYQDVNGRFRAAVYDNGKRRYVSDKTRPGVLKKLADLKVSVATGKATAKNPTIETLLKEWIQGIRRDKEPRTFEYYEGICRLHILPTLGNIKIADLDVRMVETLLSQKLASGLSVRRVAMIRATLRAALKQGERWDYCHRNVAALSKPPTGGGVSRVHMPSAGDYSVENAQAYLNAAIAYKSHVSKDPSVGNIVIVMLGTGLRIGETLGLTWAAIETSPDGQYQALRVFQQVQSVYSAGDDSGERIKTVTKALKTKASVATVSIPDFVRDALVRQSEWLDKQGYRKDGFVFATRNGTPFSPSNVRRDYQRMQSLNGLVKMRVHDMRHMCAALLIEQNVHLSVVKDVLRHTSIKTTGDVYAHVTGRARNEAVKGFDVLLSSPKAEEFEGQ
jgi:integrase